MRCLLIFRAAQHRFHPIQVQFGCLLFIGKSEKEEDKIPNPDKKPDDWSKDVFHNYPLISHIFFCAIFNLVTYITKTLSIS